MVSKTRRRRFAGPLLGVALAFAAAPSEAADADRPVTVVAAENFYGDVARQVAGPRAAVASILSNPGQDPHAFEATPSVARAFAASRIVVINGAGYDPWATRLLAATKSAGRTTIVVADLLGKAAGDNPHLWYDPDAMPAVARALESALTAADPDGETGYQARLTRFLASLQPVAAKIASIKAAHAGTPVTATEPVFGYMAASLGLAMRNETFQRAVMNETEPSAADIAAFETDLRERRVKLLLFNSQTTSPAVQRLLAIAKASGVPVVGVTETEPDGESYQAWMLDQLGAVERALASP